MSPNVYKKFALDLEIQNKWNYIKVASDLRSVFAKKMPCLSIFEHFTKPRICFGTLCSVLFSLGFF